jgi:hypothetical protein
MRLPAREGHSGDRVRTANLIAEQLVCGKYRDDPDRHLLRADRGDGERTLRIAPRGADRTGPLIEGGFDLHGGSPCYKTAPVTALLQPCYRLCNGIKYLKVNK